MFFSIFTVIVFLYYFLALVHFSALRKNKIKLSKKSYTVLTQTQKSSVSCSMSIIISIPETYLLIQCSICCISLFKSFTSVIYKVEIVALGNFFKKYQFLYKGELALSSSLSHVSFHFNFLGCFTQQCVGFSPKLGKQQFKLTLPWWIIHPSGSQLLSVCFHTWLQEKPSSIRQYFWGCSCVLITFPAYQHKNESNIVQSINFTNIGADLQLM